MQHSHAIKETFIAFMKHYYATNETYETLSALMQQCLIFMHDYDAHEQVLVAFNI
jgi:hypothetical protein